MMDTFSFVPLTCISSILVVPIPIEDQALRLKAAVTRALVLMDFAIERVIGIGVLQAAFATGAVLGLLNAALIGIVTNGIRRRCSNG